MTQICLRIGDIFYDFKLLPPTKITIDVDGNETEVLNGARDVIASCQELYFEDNGLKEDIDPIEKIQSLGFRIKAQISSNVADIKYDHGRNILFEQT